MSIIAAKLREQEAAFISLYELLETIVKHDGCHLRQAAAFLIESVDVSAKLTVQHRYGRRSFEAANRSDRERTLLLITGLSRIGRYKLVKSRIVINGENAQDVPDSGYYDFGFIRSEAVKLLKQHGINLELTVSAAVVAVEPRPPTPSPPPAAAPTTPDIDPADLPEELDAANMAFRAVFNGYGNPADTFRNRLIEYLNVNFPALGIPAIERIATVANPDKARGRPVKFKE